MTNRSMTFSQWLGLIAIIIVMVVLWQVRQLLLLLFSAIVIAVALDTLAQVPQRRGFARGPSLLITTLTVVVLLIAVGLLVIPALIDQFSAFIDLVPRALNQTQVLVEDILQRLPTDVELPSLREVFNTLIPQTSRLIEQSFSLFSSSLNVAISLFLVLILTTLLLVDPLAYADAFTRIFPNFYRPKVRFILKRCTVSLRGWVLGVLINSLFVSLISGIGLMILGIPLVLANAVIAFFFNFIPNIGPTLSVIPPILVALTVAPWKAVGVLILYVIIQNVETAVLTPMIMARQVSLLPGLILIAQLIFASFFGFLGLFLALPLAAVVQVWLQEAIIRDVLDRWEGSSEALPPSLQTTLSEHQPVTQRVDSGSAPATSSTADSDIAEAVTADPHA